MASELATQHVEATGHTVILRDCGSHFHTHRSSEWCIECGNYVIDNETLDDAGWDDPEKLEWP